MDGLAFADFAFQNVDAKRIEDFFLNRALERARAVSRIITFARDQLLGRIRKVERDLLLLEPFRQTAQLNFNDVFEFAFTESLTNDHVVHAYGYNSSLTNLHQIGHRALCGDSIAKP
jgi:hypothetical protein